MDNNISVDGFAGLAELFERNAREQPLTTITVVNFDRLPIALAVEPRMEEAVAMVRRNGGTVVYSRTAYGSQVVWSRICIQTTNSLTAWFFREIVEINQGR